MKKFRLPKEFGQKWIEALRSGQYLQGTGALITITDEGHKNHYCCLGVACKVAEMDNDDFMEYNTIPVSGKYFNDVPSELRGDAYGGRAENLLIDYLVTMNDEDGKNFNEIADWIEENVKFY